MYLLCGEAVEECEAEEERKTESWYKETSEMRARPGKDKDHVSNDLK